MSTIDSIQSLSCFHHCVSAPIRSYRYARDCFSTYAADWIPLESYEQELKEKIQSIFFALGKGLKEEGVCQSVRFFQKKIVDKRIEKQIDPFLKKITLTFLKPIHLTTFHRGVDEVAKLIAKKLANQAAYQMASIAFDLTIPALCTWGASSAAGLVCSQAGQICSVVVEGSEIFQVAKGMGYAVGVPLVAYSGYRSYELGQQVKEKIQKLIRKIEEKHKIKTELIGKSDHELIEQLKSSFKMVLAGCSEYGSFVLPPMFHQFATNVHEQSSGWIDIEKLPDFSRFKEKLPRYGEWIFSVFIDLMVGETTQFCLEKKELHFLCDLIDQIISDESVQTKIISFLKEKSIDFSKEALVEIESILEMIQLVHRIFFQLTSVLSPQLLSKEEFESLRDLQEDFLDDIREVKQFLKEAPDEELDRLVLRWEKIQSSFFEKGRLASLKIEMIHQKFKKEVGRGLKVFWEQIFSVTSLFKRNSSALENSVEKTISQCLKEDILDLGTAIEEEIESGKGLDRTIEEKKSAFDFLMFELKDQRLKDDDIEIMTKKSMSVQKQWERVTGLGAGLWSWFGFSSSSHSDKFSSALPVKKEEKSHRSLQDLTNESLIHALTEGGQIEVIKKRLAETSGKTAVARGEHLIRLIKEVERLKNYTDPRIRSIRYILKDLDF